MPNDSCGILERLAASAAATMRRDRTAVPLDRLLKEARGIQPPSMGAALSSTDLNIIAEIKYAQPGKPIFDCDLTPQDLARIYEDNGAAAISVLTEENHFCGSLRNLSSLADSGVNLPLLRKDFILDEYQVAEAAAAGASSYLLIVALLEDERLLRLIDFGRELGMEPLVEAHSKVELESAVDAGARIVGINNRDLRTLEVSLETSFSLIGEVGGESGLLLVSESGISTREQLLGLRNAGFHAFLIGSSLMTSPDPGLELRKLLGTEDVD